MHKGNRLQMYSYLTALRAFQYFVPNKKAPTGQPPGVSSTPVSATGRKGDRAPPKGLCVHGSTEQLGSLSPQYQHYKLQSCQALLLFAFVVDA